MAASNGVQDEGLVRVIGTGALGLNVVNMVIGAGIFAMPGLDWGGKMLLAAVVMSIYSTLPRKTKRPLKGPRPLTNPIIFAGVCYFRGL